MTLNWKTTYFPVLGVNISQAVRTAVARLPLRQLGFLAINTDIPNLRCGGRLSLVMITV